jgi:hypothetical protein
MLVVLQQACNAYSTVLSSTIVAEFTGICGVVTSDITLSIFVNLGTFVKLLSVQGHSLDFRSSDFHPFTDTRPRTFVSPQTFVQCSFDFRRTAILCHVVLPS